MDASSDVGRWVWERGFSKNLKMWGYKIVLPSLIKEKNTLVVPSLKYIKLFFNKLKFLILQTHFSLVLHPSALVGFIRVR